MQPQWPQHGQRPAGPAALDVRDFGALGNGETADTRAIQTAIDECAQQGGGRVVVPAGRFLTGTLHLRSGVDLHLAQDAVLLGSPRLEDYFTDPAQSYAPAIIGPVLVFAVSAQRIALSGPGTIDGNGALFPRQMATRRPVLVRFRDCDDVQVSGLRLRDGASWTVHTIGCRNVRLEDLSIHSVLHLTNDGLDIDGCEQVLVRHCSILTSDDGVALKATQPGRPCRHVTVQDCRISSYCQAIRVGPETVADIQNVSVRDCVLTDTGMGGICVQATHGGTVSDLVFRDIVMERVSNPISVRLGGWQSGDDNSKCWFLDDSRWAEGQLRDVLFRGIRATVPRRYLEGTPKESRTFLENERTCITITGTTTTRPARIRLEDAEIIFPGGGTSAEAARVIPELDRQYPTPYMFGVPPAYGLFARHVDGLTLRNVRFRLASADERPAQVCDDVTAADLAGLVVDPSCSQPLRP